MRDRPAGTHAVLLLVLLPVGLAAPARALSLADDPILIDIGGTPLGTIALEAASTGLPDGATVLEGTPGPSDTSLAFRITLAPTAFELGSLRVAATSPVGPTPRNPTGGGVAPGTGVAIGSVERVLAGTAEMLSFLFEPDGLGPGQTSAVFFVAFSDLEPGDLLQFGIPTPGRVDFVSTRVVPEPAPAALVLGGLAGLALAHGRRGARSGRATGRGARPERGRRGPGGPRAGSGSGARPERASRRGP